MPTADLAKKIHEKFKSRQITLAVAESCTGGALASELVKIPGASEFFVGSVVVYSNRAKTELLAVKKTILAMAGAVSLEVAAQMAQGVRQKLNSTWSVAITGIAGPGGGTKAKPVGTVCIAVAGPGFEYKETNLFTGVRENIIALAIKRSMELIIEHTQ